MIPFRQLGSLRSQVGESPVWDDRRGVLFLCDILGPAIHRVALDGTLEGSWQFDRAVGALGLTESGRLVVALGRDIAVFDPETGETSPLAKAPEPETNRLNDGKVGPDGCFYVGSMDDRPSKEPLGSLYRVRADGSVERVAQGFKVSNGLAWSPDGRRLYHSDSRGPTIETYTFDPVSGALSDRRRFADLDDAAGRPDGGACDREGCYWSAGVSAGVLNRFDPGGRLIDRCPVPVQAPTMPCFCGPDLRLLAVTSLRIGLDGDGADGGIFIAESAVAGAAVARMKGL
ncbi:SMP-30/gluconolactonase/LRE family protein [Microvirga pudoricolor]|uniref:SMP-30/gluconolactonase/LRE family protein n=1 Tax=Microvirga pudoricolor TaxID=2778729 RepID=UPI001951AB47|nr:SMP-30/gluconolactonase/LRE family protein [Microvirga pudoricolor]MBM6593145.1 SMP-30/gluconolactonase/LRE family protein [Microvirga pudoricolor]